MAKTVITKEHEEFARENYLKMSCSDIDLQFSVSKGCTMRFLKRSGIEVPKSITNKLRASKKIGRTTFSHIEDDFIRENYLIMPIKTIAKELERSDVGIKGRLKAMKLEIPKELANERKRKGMFRKGHDPANKGMKMEDFMSPETIVKFKSNQFSKGHIPHNALDDFEESLRHDKNGRIYTMIKVPGKRKLILKHIYVYEKEKGKVPKGHNVVFKNGNTKDFRIENLECVSDAELMRRNTIHNYPEELREIIQLKGVLKRQINKKIKEQNG